MLDRVLARLLNIVVLGLIAFTAAASVVAGYAGFTLLVRARPTHVGWLFALCLLTGLAACGLVRNRADLSDC